jgi:hypothetical protein
MSEHCYDDQLSAIIEALQDQDIRLLQISASLIEITTFLAEFKKNWGEPSWMEASSDCDDKESASYFMTKMTQEEFDAIRKFVETKPYKPNMINTQYNPM